MEKYIIYMTYIFFVMVAAWGIKKEKIGIQKEEYFSRLNLFRGIFALDIIIGHVAGQNMLPLMPFEKFSIVSVAGFFFLSGCGLSNSFHRKKNYLREIPKKIIYLFCVTLTLYFVKIIVQCMSGCSLNYIPDSIASFGRIYFQTTNWYIWELMLLYVVFALIYELKSRKLIGGGYCVIAISAITFLIGLGFALNGTIVAWYYSILGFPLGILFWEYFDSFIWFIHRWYGWAVIVLLAAGGLIGHFGLAGNTVGSYITRNMFCAACIMIIILVIERVKIDNKAIRCLTDFSLELYLYQSLWLDLTQNIAADYFVRMLIVLGGTFAAAVLVHPVNKFIKKIVSSAVDFVYSKCVWRTGEKIDSSERLRTWDIVKGIAIFLVVVGHLLEQTFCVGEIFQRLIVFCHMPIFFFCSGFFLFHSLNKHSKSILLLEKTKKLIIPYIGWSFISFSANIALNIRNEEILQVIKSEFLEIFIYARSVWFLVVLFITQFICIGLILFSERMRVDKYLLLIFGWIVISICAPNAYFSLYKFKWLFPFLIIGLYYAENSEKINKIQRYGLLSFLFPLLCITLYNPLYYNMYLEFGYSSFKAVGMGIVYYLVSLLGIIFVFECAFLLNKTRLGDACAYLGKHSMEIYVMHMLFIKFIVFVPQQMYGSNTIWTYMYILLYAVVIVGLILLLSRIIFSRFKIYNIVVGNGTNRR